MYFDKKIVEIRKKNNLTQEDLAEKLNVSRQTVSNWETNKCYPDIETLVLISDKFNISLDILIKENEDLVKNIDKKVRISKMLKYSLIVLFIALIVGCIIIFSKNNKINDVLAKNDELKEELSNFINIPSNHMVLQFDSKKVDISNLIIEINKKVDIYSNDSLIVKNATIIVSKDEDGNSTHDLDTVSYIWLNVSEEEFYIVKRAEVNNEKIVLKNTSY